MSKSETVPWTAKGTNPPRVEWELIVEPAEGDYADEVILRLHHPTQGPLDVVRIVRGEGVVIEEHGTVRSNILAEVGIPVEHHARSGMIVPKTSISDAENSDVATAIGSAIARLLEAKRMLTFSGADLSWGSERRAPVEMREEDVTHFVKTRTAGYLDSWVRAPIERVIVDLTNTQKELSRA